MAAGKTLAALTVAAVAALIAAIARFGAVPTRWLAPAAVTLAALVLALATALWRTRLPRQRRRFGALASAAVLVLTGSAWSYAFAGDIREFFFVDIQPPAQLTSTYDVIALAGHAAGVPSLAGERVARLAADPHRAEAEATLAAAVNVTLTDYPDLGPLTEALLDGSADAALLDRAYLSLYDMNRPGFEDEYKVLYSFTLSTPAPAAATPAATPKPAPAAGEPFLVYLSGIDQYGSIAVRGRSDVNILAAVDPAARHILLVNTPRDYYVQLHGTTGLRDKLTHAGVYGIEMSVATMEDLYGVGIDYYIRVNFDTVVTLVDLVGGVDVYSDQAFTTLHGHYAIVQGWNHLDGDQALGFGRERYAFSTGDRVRGENQQRVIEAVIGQVLQPGLLVRFGELRAAIAGGLETSVPADFLMALANRQLAEGGEWTIERIGVDGFDATAPTYSYNAPLYVMEPDPASLDAARARLADALGG
jgi:LCP family protein required for cell wall assembly